MQVGDYVRTKRGQIHKITDLKAYYENGELIEDNQLVHIDNHFSGWELGQFKELIIKSSPNIIDLIQEGDYVNGMEVMEADWFNENGEYEEGLAFPMYASDDLQVIENWLPLRSVNIKSIVTKEQFKSVEYKIEVDKE